MGLNRRALSRRSIADDRRGDGESRAAVRNTKFHAPARIARARWHFDGRPSLVGRHGLVDGCKWRQPRSLWHGLATSSTPTVRPASEPCAERSPSAQRSVRSLSEPGDVATPLPGEVVDSRGPWNPGRPSARTTALARRRYRPRTVSSLSEILLPFLDRYVVRSSAFPDPSAVDSDGRVRVSPPSLSLPLASRDGSPGAASLSRITVGIRGAERHRLQSLDELIIGEHDFNRASFERLRRLNFILRSSARRHIHTILRFPD